MSSNVPDEVTGTRCELCTDVKIWPPSGTIPGHNELVTTGRVIWKIDTGEISQTLLGVDISSKICSSEGCKSKHTARRKPVGSMRKNQQLLTEENTIMSFYLILKSNIFKYLQ